MVIEIFTIFLPCWEVMRSKTLHKETLDTIAQWEFRTKTNSAGKSLASGSSMVETIVSGMKSTTGSVETTSSAESVLTMSALEYVLERNPSPLQEFAALRDFSGENIAFLTSVAEWKNSVPKWMRDNPDLQDEHSRELARERFNRALRIYVEFISVRHAEFPINISFTDLRHLESVFQTPARIMYGEELNVASVTPFDKGAIPLETPVTPASSHGSETAINAGISSAILDRVQYWGDVPDGFDMAVFDSAEKSIKYLVLTNTWPRFIKDLRSPRTSSSSTLEAGQFS